MVFLGSKGFHWFSTGFTDVVLGRVSGVFPRNSEGVQGCSRVFQECFRGFLKSFMGFEGVSGVFQKYKGSVP